MCDIGAKLLKLVIRTATAAMLGSSRSRIGDGVTRFGRQLPVCRNGGTSAAVNHARQRSFGWVGDKFAVPSHYIELLLSPSTSDDPATSEAIPTIAHCRIKEPRVAAHFNAELLERFRSPFTTG
jgi:hypothetical protein